MKRKSDCPWTSTRKRKKQRKTTESISEHKKTTLAQSDKGSWFDQVKWLDEEELNASVSARKLCSEIDSDDRTEKRNNIVVDINLLNGAIERSLVCKFCQCPVFCEELEERSGQGVTLGFICTNVNCSLVRCLLTPQVNRESFSISTERLPLLFERLEGDNWQLQKR